MPSSRIKAVWLFLAVCLAYTAWMTGFTFRFSECGMFPNSNMLAESFLNGRLFISSSTPLTDTLIKDGRHYFYSGPLPALLRVPSMLLLKKGIPTGAMIIFFCAGIIVFFMGLMDELLPPKEKKYSGAVAATFLAVFILNGFSLLMVAIPSFHNEAISAAMFFLLAALYLLIKIHKQRYRVNIRSVLLFGLALSCCAGSRISYVFSVGILGGILAAGILKNRRQIPAAEIVRSLGLIGAIGCVTAGALLWYNYARFDSAFDFGTRFQLSLYKNYMMQQGIFRYDHLPYNFWSFFFRLPGAVAEFPYVTMPAYILKVQSVGPMPYFLLNGNELAVSIFCLMPIMLLSFGPLIGGRFKTYIEFNLFGLVAALFVVQVVVISLSLAAIARYYYDFFALMMLIAFMGGSYLRSIEKISDGLVVLLGALSLIISFALPMNAVRFYEAFIRYPSPLLRIFF